jgi:hypothetical protein
MEGLLTLVEAHVKARIVGTTPCDPTMACPPIRGDSGADHIRL